MRFAWKDHERPCEDVLVLYCVRVRVRVCVCVRESVSVWVAGWASVSLYTYVCVFECVYAYTHVIN